MEDSKSKQDFTRYIKNITNENNIHKVEFEDVMNLFKKPVEKIVSIKDLHNEIINLKNKIRNYFFE